MFGHNSIRNDGGSSLSFVNSKTRVYLGEGETIVFLLRMAPKQSRLKVALFSTGFTDVILKVKIVVFIQLQA